MRPLPIDFGPAGGRPRHRLAWWLVAGAVALATALAPAWMRAWAELRAAEQAHQDAQSRHDRQTSDAGPAAAPLHASAEQALARLQTPWSRMLASIESAGGQDVTLLSLEPDATAQGVRIQAQAKDMPALIAYVRTLATVPDFPSVQLESHQVQLQHARQPIDGAIVVRWSARALPADPAAPAGNPP